MRREIQLIRRMAPLVVRLAGVVASTLALIVYIPRAMEIPDLGVPSAGVSAGLLVVCSVLWLLEHRWAALFGSLAAVGLSMVVIASERGATDLEVALSDAALPLILPLLAASVIPMLTWSAVMIGCGLLSGPVHAMLYDAFLDPDCESGCDPGRFTVRHLPRAASTAANVGAWTAAIVLTVSVVVSPRRRMVLSAVALASWWELRSHDLRLLLAAGFAVALTLGHEALAAIIATVRLRELVVALDNTEDLEGSLRSATLDPDLTIEYLVAGRIEPPFGAAARTNETVVHRDGRPLALIRSEHSMVDIDALAAALNGPARLAFEVEQLRAMSALKAQQVDASRSRIVASGDDARRRLERDIHDGAQQQVLSLGMQLKLALLDVDDEAQRHVLELCLERVGATLNDLRGVAHTLRPFPLEIGGLDAALHAVGARARVPVSIGSVVTERLDAPVEQTVMAVVQSVLSAARGPVELEVVRDNSDVRIRISGVDASAVWPRLSDRVAAAGGRVEAQLDVMEVWVPCES